jgi:hypothetical protein
MTNKELAAEVLAVFYAVEAQELGRTIDVDALLMLHRNVAAAAQQLDTALARAVVRWIDTNRTTYLGDDLLRINLVEAAHQAYLVMLAEVQA